MTFMEGLSTFCVIIVAVQVIRALYYILYNHLGPILGINKINYKDLGKWAVVTGATDGLGKAYAENFAKKGMSIVLISRDQTKLDKVADEIATNYKVETKTIAVDFSEGERVYHFIDKQLESLDIGVLVNNVGISYPHPEYFLAAKDNYLYQNIINCNILSVTYMCKIVMPGMVDRKRGVIVNMSSAAAVIPNPLLTVYAATKAYVDKFSYDLRIEYGKYGIVIQSVLPGYVATNMSKIKRPSRMAPSPQQFVKEAVKTIGIEDHTTGYVPHTLMNKVIHAMEYISPKMCHYFVMSTLDNIRRRALKHKQIN